MKKIIYISFLIGLLFLIPSVLAWGPMSHTYIIDKVKGLNSTNEILVMCLDSGINEEAFRAGVEMPDITVIYYFSEGGKSYKATHNWNFQQEVLSRSVTDNEKCFAYGIAEHLITDSISHTKSVPEKIMLTKIPNWIAHPLLEKKYDSELITKAHPEQTEKSRRMLDAMYGPYGSRYTELFEYALGENNEIDVKKETDNLAFALGAFYKEGLVPKVKDNSLFAIYPYIDSFTNSIHPLIGQWTMDDLYIFMDKSSEMSINTFSNWGSRYSLSPHGFDELLAADKQTLYILPGLLILFILLSITLPIYLVIRTKKLRYSLLVFLVFPLIFIVLTIIYSLL